MKTTKSAKNMRDCSEIMGMGDFGFAISNLKFQILRVMGDGTAEYRLKQNTAAHTRRNSGEH